MLIALIVGSSHIKDIIEIWRVVDIYLSLRTYSQTTVEVICGTGNFSIHLITVKSKCLHSVLTLFEDEASSLLSLIQQITLCCLIPIMVQVPVIFSSDGSLPICPIAHSLLSFQGSILASLLFFFLCSVPGDLIKSHGFQYHYMLMMSRSPSVLQNLFSLASFAIPTF